MTPTDGTLERSKRIADDLQHHDQAHVLEDISELDPGARSAFLDQLEAIDLAEIDRLMAGVGVHDGGSGGELAPAPFVPRGSDEAQRHRSDGEALLCEGKVAAFTVAGGQGTRLGWPGPKGTFPATPIEKKPLFQVFADQLKAASKRYGVTIPWYVMTSPLNDAETRAFFDEHAFFGLDPDSISFFAQGVMPAVNETGRLLLERPGHLALSPDGHGGSLRALARSGALANMQERGITTISYFQVDNPTVHAIDPVFLGLHVAAEGSSGEMSSKMVRKCSPEEKVGVFCAHGDGVCVIEYSDLDPTLAARCDANGELEFLSGSIALHALGVAFIDRLTAPDSPTRMPFHLARKKVPIWDPVTGTTVEPAAPTASSSRCLSSMRLPLRRVRSCSKPTGSRSLPRSRTPRAATRRPQAWSCRSSGQRGGSKRRGDASPARKGAPSMPRLRFRRRRPLKGEISLGRIFRSSLRAPPSCSEQAAHPRCASAGLRSRQSGSILARLQGRRHASGSR